MTFQNVPDGLITHLVAEGRQCAGDPVVPPGSIVFRETDNQLFDFLVNPRTTGVLSVLRPVELLRHQAPMPGQDGLGSNDARDFFERLLAQFLSNLGQRPPLTVSKS